MIDANKITEEKIVTEQSILRQVSRETSVSEVEKRNLVSRLITANKTAWTKGAGLAAIQIGIPIRAAWYVLNGKHQVLINPVILKTWGIDEMEEGCLSIPNKYTNVQRAITIEYLTNGKRKKTSGFEARLIQHEIDHMDGILNIDKELICRKKS